MELLWKWYWVEFHILFLCKIESVIILRNNYNIPNYYRIHPSYVVNLEVLYKFVTLNCTKNITLFIKKNCSFLVIFFYPGICHNFYGSCLLFLSCLTFVLINVLFCLFDVMLYVFLGVDKLIKMKLKL
jgi:hypothetical protein